jgi:hypothetical protein
MDEKMKSLTNLTTKEENIVDTILMRCEREWVNPRQLAREFNLPNTNCLIGFLRILRQEGYVFEKKLKKQPRTNLNESWYRIVDYKPKKVGGV